MVSEMSGVAATGRLWGMDQASSVLLAALIIAGAPWEPGGFCCGEGEAPQKNEDMTGGVA